MSKISFLELAVFGAVISAITRFVIRFIQIRKMRKKEEQEQNENN